MSILILVFANMNRIICLSSKIQNILGFPNWNFHFGFKQYTWNVLETPKTIWYLEDQIVLGIFLVLNKYLFTVFLIVQLPCFLHLTLGGGGKPIF